MKNVQDYVDKSDVVKLCQELVRIPSVSSPKVSAVKEEKLACALEGNIASSPHW